MNKYLPSKKFIAIFALIVLFGGGLFFLSRYQRKMVIKNQEAIKVKLGEFVDRDSDNDGVKDWEEALWGTDPLKEDTNDDGISDKDDIDKKKFALNQQSSGGDIDEGNETDVFSKELFTTLISLKETGALTPETISDLAQKLGNNVSTKKDLPVMYTSESLEIVDKSDTATVKTYHDRFQKVVDTYSTKHLGEELVVFDEATVAEDDSRANELYSIGESYRGFAEALSKIPVPKEIAIKHLALLNASYNAGIAVTNMSKTFENPLVGAIGLGQYEAYGNTVAPALQSIQIYFKNSGILQ